MGRGLLVFKGEEKAKKKKKKSKLSSSKKEDVAAAVAEKNERSQRNVADAAPPSSAKPGAGASKETAPVPQIKDGTGQITVSGTVVTGYDTRFGREINVGDALLVTIDRQQEMRVVTMRLSDISLNLSSAFSQNVTRPVSFQYIPKPRDKAREAARAESDRVKRAAEEELQAAGTYGRKDELVYREKTQSGSYQIRREKVDQAATRGDLLNMRTKKKSDKYCW
jgi:hypothetical protein